MKQVLEVVSLGKKYGRSIALADFSLSIRAGSIHGLLGPNGSGKTTALHILTGLIVPDVGSSKVNGLSTESKKSRSLIGFAPDDLPMPATLSGKEYLMFIDSMRERKDSKTAEPLIEALGLENDLSKQIGQYSHGMKRKLQIVAAMMHTPELVVLDEPFRGLDPDASSVLRETLSSFAASGRAVLIATHDMLRAERDCEAVTVLSKGSIVAAGAPKDLVGEHSATNLEEVFLRVTGLHQSGSGRRELLTNLFSRNEEG